MNSICESWFSPLLLLDVNKFFNFYIPPQELQCELPLSAADRVVVVMVGGPNYKPCNDASFSAWVHLHPSLEIDRKRQVQIMST